MRASFAIEASDGSARAGHVQTARGSFPTPCFMPVGTRGAVRHLTSLDLEALDAHVVLANTYHLMLRPGADVVESLGGLHGFTRWNRHMLTDSGGYQVFSLEPKVDEEGATFRSVYDGSTHILTPESAVLTQSQLGADIQMVLDVCPGLPAPEPVLRKAVDTSALWAGRARHQFLSGASHEWQCQFGIVQGGTDLELRQESAERTVEMGFDGYAVGGLSVGEQRNEMVPALGVVTELLPADQPRYFMGLGDPVGIVEAVAQGVDMFDCVLPTRLARHGTLLTGAGRMNLGRAEFRLSDEPLDPSEPDSPAATWSKGYLRHLLMVKEPTAARVLTLHNLWWLLRFVDRLRDSIIEQRFDRFRSEVLDVWGAMP